MKGAGEGVDKRKRVGPGGSGDFLAGQGRDGGVEGDVGLEDAGVFQQGKRGEEPGLDVEKIVGAKGGVAEISKRARGLAGGQCEKVRQRLRRALEAFGHVRR